MKLLKYKKRLIKTSQSGDTIIEVLLALAVLGLAIGISYAIADKSLLYTRQAQENATAENIVRSQIELLRSLSGQSSSSANYPFTSTNKTNYFCIDSDNNIVTFATGANINNIDGTTTDYPTMGPEIAPVTPVTKPCEYNNTYFISISWDGTADSTFIVKAIWDDVLGYDHDSVSLEYRMLPTT